MDISKLEAKLQKKINHFIHKRKGDSLELDDVKEELKRELFHRKKSGGDDYLPNNYEFCMNPLDYRRLSSKRFFVELYLFAEKTIIVSDCYIRGNFQFKLLTDKRLSQGKCLVNSYFDSEGEALKDSDFHTVIMDKSLLSDINAFSCDKEFASLSVMRGNEKDFRFNFGKERVRIGRKDNNDMVLSDMNISRNHAYISFENGRHVLHDNDSLNGTFVNGKRIDFLTLKRADEILLGNTRLLYDVIQQQDDGLLQGCGN